MRHHVKAQLKRVQSIRSDIRLRCRMTGQKEQYWRRYFCQPSSPVSACSVATQLGSEEWGSFSKIWDWDWRNSFLFGVDVLRAWLRKRFTHLPPPPFSTTLLVTVVKIRRERQSVTGASQKVHLSLSRLHQIELMPSFSHEKTESDYH